MAFPPPYNNPMMAPRMPQPNQPGQFTGQKFGFFSPQTTIPTMPPQVMQMQIPQLPIVGGVQLTLRPNFRPFVRRPAEAPPTQFVPPVKPVAVTTVFIGNITDLCEDSLIQEILGKCGTVHTWKRLQDPNGNFKAFGFCEFVHPDGTRRALRVLKDYPLGEKRLNVKVDDATEKYLKEFAENQTRLLGMDSGTPKSINPEEDDKQLRAAIKAIIEKKAPGILEVMPEDDVAGDAIVKDGSQKDVTSKSPVDDETSKVHKRKHSLSPSGKKKRSSSKSRHSKHDGSHSKRSRRHSSDSNSSSGSSTATLPIHPSPKKSTSSSRHHRKGGTPSSEDSYVLAEKRRLKKELAEREESYITRLKKWEEREKRMAKQYAKDRESEVQRKKTIDKEAKKLRQFLEDYVDERDDLKYYKGSALLERRRNYEREREADAKDRHEEKREMEEVKKQLLKEKEEQEKLLLQQQKEKEKETTQVKEIWETVPGRPHKNGIENKEKDQPLPPPNNEEDETSSPSPVKKPIITTIQQKTIQPVNGLFEEDEEEEDTLHQIKKKIKPFEITREDRIQSLTPEERKKLIKDLITRIPTEREQLFAFSLSWEFLDKQLMDSRVRPWINKKICEYIGEEEPSLVSFICEKIDSRASPDNILADLSMVLDDEAEVFTVKLWRLIVYESEAKRLGLNVLPQQQQHSSNSANRSSGK
uniref:Uncharacterized protein n=1 Tax=Meloidogyne enterolobii TaxID=390850 RepID=A0A6V7U7L4_MELEN|nr:unnamed protein product [Meloidogyne enterolobii]